MRDGGSGERDQPPRSQPPTARLDTREKTVTVGDSFELTCHVTGVPLPQVQWLYNGQPIENALGERVSISAVPGRYTLNVRDVQEDLIGYVVCRATSNDGQSAEDTAVARAVPREQSGEDNRDEEIRVQVDPRDVRGLRIGETTRLICQAQDPRGGDLR